MSFDNILFDCFSSQIITTTPTVARRSTNKSSNEESNKKKSSLPIKKRKHSSSSVPHTPTIVKKRTKNESSSMKKSHSKRKESKTEEEEAEAEDEESEQEDKPKKSPVNKRILNLDLSSKLFILSKRNHWSFTLEYKTPPAFLNDSLPDTIASNDVYLFLDARKNSAKLISDVCIFDISMFRILNRFYLVFGEIYRFN